MKNFSYISSLIVLFLQITVFSITAISVTSIASIASAENLTLPSEQDITIEEYGKSSAKNHILWMHAERGITGELQKTILAISKQENIHILLPDWLDSYFIEPTRSSLEKIPQQDYEDLIAHYSKLYNKTGDKLYIVATSRAASLVLNSTHHLQTQGLKPFAGIIFISAYLQKQSPEIGKSVEYQNITSHSNLPIYIFQSERSPRYIPLPLLVNELEKGGSPVFVHRLFNTSGGFHMRDKESLTDKDLEERGAFPKQIKNALTMLNLYEAATLKPLNKYEKNIRKRSAQQLQQVSLITPALALKDLAGSPHKLSDYKGKTILVSFWASWCRPCIEEMPSLVKLKEKYKDNLEILAVDVGEEATTIKKFTGEMNINFPLLQDLNSSTTKDWKVYVYPSNYIIDKAGKLVYASKGALDWQDTEIEAILEALF
jgi:thiol-disulfide isomerase/thioredoxin